MLNCTNTRTTWKIRFAHVFFFSDLTWEWKSFYSCEDPCGQGVIFDQASDMEGLVYEEWMFRWKEECLDRMMERHERWLGKMSRLKRTAGVLRGWCVIGGLVAQSRSLCLPHVWRSALGSCLPKAAALWSSETRGLWHWSTHTHLWDKTTGVIAETIDPLTAGLHTHTHTLIQVTLHYAPSLFSYCF